MVKQLGNDDYDLHFVQHLDRLHASPDTDIYSNPSDLVWMNWIGERENRERIFVDGKELDMPFAVTEVTRTSINGEQYMKMPSKLIRNVVGIVEMQGPFLFNKHGVIAAFMHKIPFVDRESQEIVLVDRDVLKKALADNGMELVWFADFFKAKEVSIPESEDVPHFQKCLKYFVYEDAGSLRSVKFWDERFSNTRDRFQPERIEALEAEVKEYAAFSKDDIAQIEQLIIEGGEVDPKTLPDRLKEAKAIAVIRDEQKLVAVAAIKQPLASYRTGVFTKAQVPGSAEEYSLELGYVYTKTKYRGFKLAGRLCRQLVDKFNDVSLFATTRTNNRAMYFILSHLGFTITGEGYENKARNANLYLYVREHSSAAGDNVGGPQPISESD